MEYQCQSGASPSDFWTYNDEDWGGFVAKMGARRGGISNPCTIAKHVLTRFRCLVTETAVFSWAPGNKNTRVQQLRNMRSCTRAFIMSKSVFQKKNVFQGC